MTTPPLAEGRSPILLTERRDPALTPNSGKAGTGSRPSLVVGRDGRLALDREQVDEVVFHLIDDPQIVAGHTAHERTPGPEGHGGIGRPGKRIGAHE